MPMHSTAPVAVPFLFDLSEVHACAWACACADVVLRSSPDDDALGRKFRRRLPELPGVLTALEAGALTPTQAHTLATVLVALLEGGAQLAPNIWAALRPPPGDVLEAAQRKACTLMGGAGRRVSVAGA